jgi:hypothetical protein
VTQEIGIHRPKTRGGLAMNQKLKSGTIFQRKAQGYKAIRIIVAPHPSDPDVLHYREIFEDGECLEGDASAAAIKRWGTVITKAEAEKIIPELNSITEHHSWRVSDDVAEFRNSVLPAALPESVDSSLQVWTKLIAMTVRNEMEDFHVEHLSDEQMKALNPIIRTAIFKTLRHIWLLKNGADSQRTISIQHLYFQMLMIPDYWENSALSEEDVENEKRFLAAPEAHPMMTSPATTAKFSSFVTHDLRIFS